MSILIYYKCQYIDLLYNQKLRLVIQSFFLIRANQMFGIAALEKLVQTTIPVSPR